MRNHLLFSLIEMGSGALMLSLTGICLTHSEKSPVNGFSMVSLRTLFQCFSVPTRNKNYIRKKCCNWKEFGTWKFFKGAKCLCPVDTQKLVCHKVKSKKNPKTLLPLLKWNMKRSVQQNVTLQETTWQEDKINICNCTLFDQE